MSASLTVTGRHLAQHDRQAGVLPGHLFARKADLLLRDLGQFGVAAPHHAQVVGYHARALAAELRLQLRLDRGEQRVLGQAGIGHGRAGGEERALEGDALHAQLQLGGPGLLAGDLEGVEVEHADLVVDDELLRPEREAGPGLLAEVGLDDEEAALLQAGQRVAVAEHGRVGREHDVDEDVFAVDADRLRRRREVVGGGLALLLRAVFRIGLDVPAEQFEQGHRQVLAGGDRAPAADRVHAHGDRALGQQVGVFRAAHAQFADARILVGDVLLMHLVLRVDRITREVDREVEELALRTVRQHVLHRADQRLGLQVARSEPVAARVQARHVPRTVVRIVGIGKSGPRLPNRARHAVLDAFHHRSAHFAHQRQVFGQRLVGALQHRDALLALEHMAQQVAGEGTEHGQIDHADLELARFAQVVRHRLGLYDHAAHADDQVIGILGLECGDALVAAPGEAGIFVQADVGQRLDVVEKVRPLCGGGLHVGILVLHRAGHHGNIHVPDRRHAATLGAEQHLLRRRRRVDQVVRLAEELRHQFALGQHRRLDQMGGEEAVLADDRGSQRQLGDLAPDQVEVGRLGRVLGHDLDEAGVIDAVVVVMAGMHVQRNLGDGAAAHVEHIGQALADSAVERLVHEGHALAGRKIDGAQTGHGHARRDACGGVLGFRLDEDQRLVGNVQVPGGDLLGPVLAHLSRRRDRVGAGGVGRLALDVDHRGIAIDGIAHAGVLDRLHILAGAAGLEQGEGKHFLDDRHGHDDFLELAEYSIAQRQGVVAQDFLGGGALGPPVGRLEPDDGPGRAAFYRVARGLVIPVVVHHRQVAGQVHQFQRRVGDALAASGAGHLARGLRDVAVRLVLARHPEAVADRFQAEQALGADLDAVVAGRAFLAVDHRQAVPIHGYRIEGADIGAVRQAEAAPGAFLATSGHHGRRAAGPEALVAGAQEGHVLAAAAGQAGHLFLYGAGSDAEQVGNALALLRRTDGAPGGNHCAVDHLFGKIAAARRAAGAAVRFGQQILDLADARVFIDVELLVGEGEHQRQDHPQPRHECPRHRQIGQRLHSCLLRNRELPGSNHGFIAASAQCLHSRQPALTWSKESPCSATPPILNPAVRILGGANGGLHHGVAGSCSRLTGRKGALTPPRTNAWSRVAPLAVVTSQL
jgi:hypothetical protein